MPTLTTSDGVTLHYTDDGAGRPLVFVTGWAMSGNWWQEQRGHFAATHRAIVIDPRAQGESEPVLTGHRLSRHAADLHDAIVTLGLSDIVLVAWSRGTSVTLSYLELYGSGAISAVALCGFLPCLGTRGDWPWGFNVPPQPFIDSVVADYKSVVSNMIVDMTHQTLDPDFVARRTEESLRTPPVAAARMLEDHMNIDWRDMLPGIDVPVLICAGEEDPQAPPPAADASAELIPHATVARFAKSGHCPFIEESVEFNRVLAAFVDAV
jgi:non-heme chloroperoxidase